MSAMRWPWLVLALFGCATGEDVGDPSPGGGGGVAGAAQGGAAGAGGWPSGGGQGGGSGGGATGGGSGGATGGAGGASGAGTGGATGCAIQGCQDGASSGSGCAQARVIGRASAGSSQGYVKTDTTCNATNQSKDFGSGCGDAGRDHTYRIFMRAGESFAATLTQGAKCASAPSWDRTFKIYFGSSCSDTSCSNASFCYSPGAGNYNKSLNVTQEGWYHLVVDGVGAEDSGSYTLTVKLTCKTPGCEC